MSSMRIEPPSRNWPISWVGYVQIDPDRPCHIVQADSRQALRQAEKKLRKQVADPNRGRLLTDDERQAIFETYRKMGETE